MQKSEAVMPPWFELTLPCTISTYSPDGRLFQVSKDVVDSIGQQLTGCILAD